MDMEQYNEIAGLTNKSLIAQALKTLTPEQRKAYKNKGNAIRNKAYRDANKDTINPRRNQQRNESKAIINIPIPSPEITNLPAIKKRAKPLNKNQDISEGTLKNYVSVMRTIYKDHYDKDIDENDDVLKMLRWEKYNYKNIKQTFDFISKDIKGFVSKYNKRLNVIYSVFSRVYGMTKLLNQLNPYLIQSNKNYDENRSKIANIDEAFLSFDKKDIINNLNKLDDRIDMLIYGLYFLTPTRRIGEYLNAKNAKTEDDIKDLKYNWYYQGKIYINASKNKTTTIIDLPEVIDLNIDQNDEYMLGKQYTHSMITTKLNSITKKVYGKEYKANEIRHLYATYINNTGASLAEREASTDGTHSVIQQLKYVYR